MVFNCVFSRWWNWFRLDFERIQIRYCLFVVLIVLWVVSCEEWKKYYKTHSILMLKEVLFLIKHLSNLGGLRDTKGYIPFWALWEIIYGIHYKNNAMFIYIYFWIMKNVCQHPADLPTHLLSWKESKFL